jgi:hypothetical protein
MKNEEAMKMQDALMGLTDQLTQLRKSHANTLAENQRIWAMNDINYKIK